MSESFLTAAFLSISGGLQDAYTYMCRGKVFANAQTGNIVLLSPIPSNSMRPSGQCHGILCLCHAGADLP